MGSREAELESKRQRLVYLGKDQEHLPRRFHSCSLCNKSNIPDSMPL